MEEIYTGYCPTPVGMFYIECTAQAVVRAGFTHSPNKETADQMPRDVPDVLHLAILQITEYFAGKRQVFNLPLAPAGSAFYRAVWDRLKMIPYGFTTTYGAIAAEVGNPKASRAVGGANNHNPIAIIIPCHRVIGANGKLVGYASGLERKQWLLDLEKRFVSNFIVSL